MSDTPWTPGPWWADLETGEIVRQENVLCLIAEGVSQVEDARLIAAAPDLFAALDAIIDGRYWSMSDDKFGAAKSALAKARGQS